MRKVTALCRSWIKDSLRLVGASFAGAQVSSQLHFHNDPWPQSSGTDRHTDYYRMHSSAEERSRGDVQHPSCCLQGTEATQQNEDDDDSSQRGGE